MAVQAAGAEQGPVPKAAAREGGRVSFRVKVALVWLGIFAVLATFFAIAKFDTAWMRQYFRFIATGLWVTIVMAVLSITLAIVLALLGALGRLSKNPVAYGVSGFYTSFFRGTPLILQLFLWYLAIPQIAQNLNLAPGIYKLFILSAVLAGILGLGFNYGAYMTEIFRAGILAVGPGQTEAAEALGMSYAQRMRRIVLPQAFKIIIPPTGNEFIAMLKDTALVGFLGTSVFWWDIFKRGQTLGSEQFKPMEGLLVAAGMYWGMTAIFTSFQSRLERRLSKGYVRQVTPAGRQARWLSSKRTVPAGTGGMTVEVPVPAQEGQEENEEPFA
jgi:polar amino acid transport system permease protein